MEGEGAMEADAAAERREVSRSAVRYGRPPRELAGQVEERILDAAGRVFLEHGFQRRERRRNRRGRLARENRPSTPDFPSKQALFTAVIERLVRRNTELSKRFPAPAARSRSGSTASPPSF